MLLRWIRWLLCPLFPPRRRVMWSVTFEELLTLHTKGDLKMQLSNEQKVKATVRPLTGGGNPARIDGPVNFTTTDESVARVEVIDDTTCYVIAVAPGTARIVANFDADLDADEVRLKEYDAEITVVEAEAESASLDFAQPEYLVLTPTGQPEVVEYSEVAANDDASVEAVAVAETTDDTTDTSEQPAP